MSALPTAPSRSDPSTFAELADAFLAALPGFGDYMEALALATSAGAFKGNYAGGTTYAAGDVVNSADVLYTSLQASNTGHTPASSPTYWKEILASKANTANPTLTDIVMVGSIQEDIYTITDGAAFEIDPSNGTVQKIVLGASRTPKFTNFANGESIVLLTDDGTSYTITWTDSTAGGSGVVWKDGGSAPSLHATRMSAVILWKFNGQVYGVDGGSY